VVDPARTALYSLGKLLGLHLHKHTADFNSGADLLLKHPNTENCDKINVFDI
jgi:hypothetical protein